MLKSLIDFLNNNAGALTVIFTAVVTISTVVYAILTSVLVKETKRMREVQTEPKIEITAQSLENAINIVRLYIKNIGLGPALNIRFYYSVIAGGEVAQNLLEEFTQTNFFNTGIKYLSPSQQIYSHYSQLTQNFEEKTNSTLLFEVEYESTTGNKYNDKIVIDMSEHKGDYQLGKPNLYAIAQSIEKIQEDLRSIARGTRHLKTDIHIIPAPDEEQE